MSSRERRVSRTTCANTHSSGVRYTLNLKTETLNKTTCSHCSGVRSESRMRVVPVTAKSDVCSLLQILKSQCPSFFTLYSHYIEDF